MAGPRAIHPTRSPYVRYGGAAVPGSALPGAVDVGPWRGEDAGVSQDQVARGYDDDDSRSTGWLLIIGVAVVAALLSLVTHHSSSGAAPPPPAPSAFAPPTPSSSPSAAPSDSPSLTPSAIPSSAPPSTDPTAAVLSRIGGYVSVADICAPITDGRKTLTVRFLLTNATPLAEDLVWVSPELPMGGLVFTTSDVQRGTCSHPTGKPRGFETTALPVHGSVIVAMHFTLPKSCPAPYPIQAVVTVRIGGKERLDTVALYTDLGTVKFDLCKTA